MELTRRQELIIRKLLDLYLEVREPLHYSVLAERLGISRFTAYDMLRLLEEKGYVTSNYVLGKKKSGPGRAEVLFMPTEKAHNEFIELGAYADRGNWEEVKERLLEKMRSGEINNHAKELLHEILARFPNEENDSLAYCVEVMTVIALRLQHSAGRRLLLDYVPIIMPEGDDTGTVGAGTGIAGAGTGTAWASATQNLALLGGFALGILVCENADDREWCMELANHVKRYQSIVTDLPVELQKKLAMVLKEIFHSFN